MSRSSKALLLVVALAAATGCKDPRSSRRPAAADPSAGLHGGRLVFSDDFERGALGEKWRNPNGTWKIVEGWAHGEKDRNGGLWLLEKLPDRARIEFDAKSLSTEGDLKCEVFNLEPRHQQGYVVIFGGWHNRINVIARLDEHGKDRREETERKVVQGKVHHFAIVRTDHALRWFLDGDLLMTYDDPDPIHGHYFGFNDWTAPVRFDNLRIFALER